MKLQLIILGFFIASCASSQEEAPDPNLQKHEKFGDYWYQGEAELTSYKLRQARYGEYRDGEAVLVFVTEPFSLRKQVKLDNPSDAGIDKVNVMKLNFAKKFLTGIYPYSMMTSSFVPVELAEYPDALKVTTSSQEWCGHTFTQINKEAQEYRFRQFSYFESEGDVNKELATDWLEDELWQRIRINPKSLPTGNISVLPGTMYMRLSHIQATAQLATAKLQEVDSSDYYSGPHMEYSLIYPERSLKIYFQKGFPYIIYGWKEVYKSGFQSSEEMVTSGRRINTIKSPYWQKNSNKDEYLREKLGIGSESESDG